MQREHEGIMDDSCRNKKQRRKSSDEYSHDDEARIPIPVSLQPTPINVGKIVPVERVSIQATTWNLDSNSIEYLKALSASKAKSPNSHPESSSPQAPASVASIKKAAAAAPAAAGYPRDATLLRQKQVDQWNIRYAELLEFRKEHGHCLVPLRYQLNRALSNWVKRQRYQYRIKSEGKHSTLNDQRQAALEKLGFVWDSHSLTWEERFQELSEFRRVHGHANVPKSYKTNQQLAVWVKSRK
ncbi:unnamed protein product [Cylindrotheca closterium]|uniref:Helicase-associated domain-containing protein n=1 Tax=Cylindrotheca closterium TaxID=2856 RepID=A0AAD2G108_9STRA|nr:unnamed protein product [Cylindrotheca closterium]CAJ1963199.1 unnamed protein product [Cylindrotheca closterium]